MHTTFSFRRGTSTILGTLIFVGILFTAVIPMFLFMRQADTFHEQSKFDLKRLDEEHSREEVNFYAYPLTGDPEEDQINIRVVNKGGAPVKIVRAWINDEDYPLDETMQSMETRVLGPLTVGLQDQTSYAVELITERGSVFSSKADTLYYSGGAWYTPSLGICVHITNFMGKYDILIEMGGAPLHHYESPRIEHGDLIRTFMVDGPGTYVVTIKKEDGGELVDLIPPVNGIEVEIVWPSPNPIVYLFASGMEV